MNYGCDDYLFVRMKNSGTAARIGLQRDDGNSIGGNSQGIRLTEWDVVTTAGRLREIAAADAHRTGTWARQNLTEEEPASAHLPRIIHVPGDAVPAGRSDSASVGDQQA